MFRFADLVSKVTVKEVLTNDVRAYMLKRILQEQSK